jgi:PAS domain S-box-containing protein
MSDPPAVNDEAGRLRSLRDCSILDSEPEERFDRLTRLACTLFATPVAFVSLVDDNREWIKSAQGSALREIARDVSLASQAILDDGIFQVEDIQKDPRFEKNPLITQAAQMRFYAGAPLKCKDGYRVGCLCLFGQEPRQLNEEELIALRDLADVAQAEICNPGLRHQEELARLSRVASQTTNGVVITDTKGRVQWVNDGFTRISGYLLEDIVGRSPGEILQGEATDPATVARMRKALKGCESFDEDLINYNKSGSPYWIHVTCNPLRNDAGELQGFMAIQTDITREKDAAENSRQSEQRLAAVNLSLKRSEARLRGLFELSHVGIALNDYETGAFVEINDALLAPTGYSLEEFVKLSYWEITPKEYESQEAVQLESMEATGRYGPYEKEYYRKDGGRYPVLLNGMVVYDPSGKKLIWSMIEDISERKRAAKLKEEFVSTVSHELRTPLTSITGALGLVVGGVFGGVPTEAAKMLGIAYRNSHRLSGLVNDLLDLEKMAAGKLEIDLQTVELMPLVEQVLRDNQTYVDQYQSHVKLSGDLSGLQLRVDPLRFQQILANLLSNAAKFSPMESTIEIRVLSQNEMARIEVIDNGPGIQAEFKDRIFQKFSQADSSSTRQKGGTGLGLAISQELVERMNGEIGYHSVEGEGCTFYCEFPIANAEV